MRIGLWLTTPRRFDPSNIDETPFGGAEISAINLAKQLSRNNYVNIFANCNRDCKNDKNGFIIYDNYFELKEYKTSFDVLICVRADQNLLNPRRNHVYFPGNKPKIILWTGDAFDQPNNQILHDKYCRKEIDLIVCKSNWQRETLLKYFPTLSPSKVQVMYNGVDADYIRSLLQAEPASSPRFVYASTAYRGLHKFLTIWPKIKKRIPDATLDCYCKTTLYLDDNARESEFKSLYDKISSLPDVTIKEPLSQQKFLKQLATYKLMLYPNDGFLESSCGVALQSMACGVPVITTYSAGLIETANMGCSSTLYPGEHYDDNFAAEVEAWNFSRENWIDKKILDNYSWKKVSEKWEKLLQTVTEMDKQIQSQGCQEFSLV